MAAGSAGSCAVGVPVPARRRRRRRVLQGCVPTGACAAGCTDRSVAVPVAAGVAVAMRRHPTDARRLNGQRALAHVLVVLDAVGQVAPTCVCVSMCVRVRNAVT